MHQDAHYSGQVASDRAVSIDGMKITRARWSINESQRTGVAKMLDDSQILPRAELIAAVVAAQNGDADAYVRVVNGMTQLIYKLGERSFVRWASYMPSSASFDDVFMAGLRGLHIAIGKYDESRGMAFTTPATWWIRTAVQRECYRLIGGAYIQEATLLSGDVSPADLLVGRQMLSLDAPDEHKFGRALHESVVGAADASVGIEQLEQVRAVYDLLSCVDPRLPRIIDMLAEDYAYREIARIMQMSVRDVEALHLRAAATLASQLSS